MKNNYFIGFIGALIGGVIFTLPWILVYVYANWLLSILGAVIGYGAFTFYKLFKGKVDKKTPVIIIIASVLSITIATFVIIPFWLLAKEGVGFSTYYFKYLYTSGEFVTGIIADYIISLLFTLLGISGIIASINKEYSKTPTSIEEVKQSTAEETFDIDSMSFEDKVKYLESIYEKYNAFSKENKVSEFKIMKQLKVTNKLKFITDMEKKGIIVAPLIGSYFDKEAVTNPEKGKKNRNKSVILGVVLGTIIGIIIAIAVVFLIFGIADSSSTNDIKYATYTYESISIDLPNTFKKAPNQEGDTTSVTYLNHGDSTISQVTLQEVSLKGYTEDMYLNYKKNYIDALKDNYTVSEEEKVVLNNLDVVRFKIVYKKNTNQVFYNYLVFNKDEVCMILFYTMLDSEIPTSDLLSFQDEIETVIKTLNISS